ncbi:MAG TPA: potassium/proton antiporter [Patescibacteria group bacterium]|nr:potassium/proton antiporter [Patescibacteria group bacterium]
MDGINLIILVCAGLAVASVFTSMIAFRAGAPLLLLFLIIGLVAGRDGPGGIVFTDAPNAYLIGSAALAVILFDSGFHTTLKSYRLAAAPAITLATLGVVITAALVALPSHYLLGMAWPQAALMGTILSSTDAAALFFLLRVGGITIRDRVRSTLEVESGTNDPVAIFLALTLVDILTGQQSGDMFTFAGRLLVQMGGGIGLGLLGGAGIIFVVNRIKLEPGLYPVVVMGLAVSVFALSNLLGGSGFLSAYLAGLVAGNAKLQSAGAIRRFQDGITWLAQIAMFVTLGLLGTPSQFPAVAWPGLVLAVALTFIARPLAVALCLLPFRFGKRETLFVSWVGLRGAVSILLALVPVLGGVKGGDVFFQISFLVVVASLLVQGWTVRPLARWLGLIVPERAGPVDRMEVDLPGLADRELVAYVLHPDSPVAQGRPLPRWARPVLLRRGDLIRNSPRQLQAGDRVYLLVAPAQVPVLDALFGRTRDEAAAESCLYGDFTIGPEVTVKALREAYDLPLDPGNDAVTLAEMFRREFRSDLEIGDRLHLGPVDLIIREMRDSRIGLIGIALEPPQPVGWERLKSRLAAVFGTR